jgi:hypothetical protein
MERFDVEEFRFVDGFRQRFARCGGDFTQRSRGAENAEVC